VTGSGGRSPIDGIPPVPVVRRTDAAFWRGGGTGALLITRCQACRTWLHPPTPACRHCLSTAVEPEPVSGRGRVRTFTVNHQPWFPALPPPYVIAIVELDEQPGLQFLTRLVGCSPDDVHTGLRVRVSFEPHGDVFLPLFTPAS
jgi:uncharacterized OB-fold protein